MPISRILSATDIRDFSFGEVTNDNPFRMDLPAEGGLFCDKIFGPTKDFECRCGNVSGRTNAGVVCKFCGVLCDSRMVCRERFGHIELPYPVINPLFIRTLATILNLNIKMLKGIQSCDIFFRLKDSKKIELFEAEDGGTGNASLYQIVDHIDTSDLSIFSTKARKKVEGLIANGNHPRDLFFTALPVLPSGLRYHDPESSRFVELNLAYSKILKLGSMISTIRKNGGISVMENQVQRALARAVNSLLVEKGRMSKKNPRPLLSYIIAKEGRFRNNLLGKRVDFSARSVLTGSPEVRLNEVGIPRAMAYELFKPHIISRLIKSGVVPNRRLAEKAHKFFHPAAKEALEVIAPNKWVLVNRAPSLHALSCVGLQTKLLGDLREIPQRVAAEGFYSDETYYDCSSKRSKLNRVREWSANAY